MVSSYQETRKAAANRTRRLGNAEVEQLELPAVVQQHARWLEVAVADAFAIGEDDGLYRELGEAVDSRSPAGSSE
jgi:hypothetical protein